jgi:nickel/cobalt transporter (NiCoT) family protein
MRWGRIRSALSPREWRTVALMAFVILGLTGTGFFVLIALVEPGEYSLGAGGAFGVGIGITAYTLGARHAFDADHIAAIDNTTRRLMGAGQRPLTVGFFFALGHSTIVCLLGVLVAVGVRGLGGAVQDDGSMLHETTGLIGPTVSGVFLIAIGLLNLAVLIGILRIFRRMKRGELSEQELERELESRGFLTRLYGRATRGITKPWQMYPLGCLFGLGFDTATEVALLVIAGGAAASDLPFYAILCLPILFAAGMTLFDTIDGAFMNFAYGWALSEPVRKVFYNLAVTGLSVSVALAIGTIQLTSAAVAGFDLSGEPWQSITGLDMNYVGYAIVGLFIATWVGAYAVWRLGRIEERWSGQPRSPVA